MPTLFRRKQKERDNSKISSNRLSVSKPSTPQSLQKRESSSRRSSLAKERSDDHSDIVETASARTSMDSCRRRTLSKQSGTNTPIAPPLKAIGETPIDSALNAFDDLDEDDDGLIVTVTLRRASNLPKMDSFLGKCDAYVRLSLAGHERTTSVVKNSTEPCWNEVFAFPTNVFADHIDFDIFDYDRIKKNDPIGSAQASLSEARLGSSCLMHLPICGRDAKSQMTKGILEVEVEVLPHGRHEEVTFLFDKAAAAYKSLACEQVLLVLLDKAVPDLNQAYSLRTRIRNPSDEEGCFPSVKFKSRAKEAGVVSLCIAERQTLKVSAELATIVCPLFEGTRWATPEMALKRNLVGAIIAFNKKDQDSFSDEDEQTLHAVANAMADSVEKYLQRRMKQEEDFVEKLVQNLSRDRRRRYEHVIINTIKLRRTELLRVVFGLWFDYAITHYMKRALERRVREKCMKFLVKDWVLYWRSFAADSARRKRLLKKAYNNWVVRCVALAFSAWKRKTEEMIVPDALQSLSDGSELFVVHVDTEESLQSTIVSQNDMETDLSSQIEERPSGRKQIIESAETPHRNRESAIAMKVLGISGLGKRPLVGLLKKMRDAFTSKKANNAIKGALNRSARRLRSIPSKVRTALREKPQTARFQVELAGLKAGHNDVEVTFSLKKGLRGIKRRGFLERAVPEPISAADMIAVADWVRKSNEGGAWSERLRCAFWLHLRHPTEKPKSVFVLSTGTDARELRRVYLAWTVYLPRLMKDPKGEKHLLIKKAKSSS